MRSELGIVVNETKHASNLLPRFTHKGQQKARVNNSLLISVGDLQTRLWKL